MLNPTPTMKLLDAADQIIATLQTENQQLQRQLLENIRMHSGTVELWRHDAELLREKVDALQANKQRLQDAASDYLSQYVCGCGHPTCSHCENDQDLTVALEGGL